jgi:hypothetical protein
MPSAEAIWSMVSIALENLSLFTVLGKPEQWLP